MLQNTLLSNLSSNLGRMDKLQNQMSSGRKYGHISDDPSALIYGQAARNKLARLSHYQATVSTAQSWLTQAEAGVMELQKVVGAVYEELVSAGSVKTDDDKKKLGMVVDQLRSHYLDTLNTSFGDRFVFGGYNTPGDFAVGRAPEIKPFTIDDNGHMLFNGFNISQFDGVPSRLLTTDFSGMTRQEAIDRIATFNPPVVIDQEFLDGINANRDPALANADAFVDELLLLHNLLGDVKSLDVGPGINMDITLNGIDILFYTAQHEDGSSISRNTYDMLSEVYNAINGIDTGEEATSVDPLGTNELTKLITLVQGSQNHLLTRAAEIGGRQRRLELLEARYETDTLNYEKMRSDAEDADMAEVIMYLKMAETVYQAALSAGARVIQPTLMDFLR
jgi:flagellar hook-associated protein 3 FlgL